MQQIIKESLIVCIWIGFLALILWGTDRFGLLSSTPYTASSTSLQVDFPAVYQMWKQGDAVFVDARSAANFKRGHIPGAISVPANRVKHGLSILPENKDTLIITYCGNVECPNAYQLLNALLAHDYRNVKMFPQGLKGWQTLGYPLETE
ncbi:rhodanese-like domain-containing protein [Candidatus Poribacteria bacterium]|nr:rhodanese-like domain-containing protein [Candidatus Poribacteria bacterium]MYB66100.1 rhodanese-like domain-containing protein [Candidatus Poribacteria bacterium]